MTTTISVVVVIVVVIIIIISSSSLPNSNVHISQVFFWGRAIIPAFFFILTSPRIYVQGFAKLIPVPIIGRVNCSIRLGFCVPNQYANQSFKLYLV